MCLAYTLHVFCTHFACALHAYCTWIICPAAHTLHVSCMHCGCAINTWTLCTLHILCMCLARILHVYTHMDYMSCAHFIHVPTMHCACDVHAIHAWSMCLAYNVVYEHSMQDSLCVYMLSTMCLWCPSRYLYLMLFQHKHTTIWHKFDGVASYIVQLGSYTSTYKINNTIATVVLKYTFFFLSLSRLIITLLQCCQWAGYKFMYHNL